MSDVYSAVSPSDEITSPRHRLLDATGHDQLRDAPDAHRRLQALIANWLRMENVVCLLGAGCSVSESIGGRTMGQLEDAVLSLVREKWKTNEPIKNLIEARQAEKDGADALGFEKWLSILSSVSSLTSQKGSPVEAVSFKVAGIEIKTLDDLLKDIESAIYGLCAVMLDQPSESPSGHHAFFGKLIARDPSLGRSQVFTLNYDAVIEQALDHLGIYYFDGFSGRVEPKFDPACYGHDLYYPGNVSEGRVRRFDRFLHVYKLHGSVHWVRRSDGQISAKQPSLSRAYPAGLESGDSQRSADERVWRP